jgi:hypothetical protein
MKTVASTADPCECNATIQSTAKGFAAREFGEVEKKADLLNMVKCHHVPREVDTIIA